MTDRDSEARKTLIAIRGYVQHFFGCEECSRNFMKGAVHIENRVQTAEDAVLFLWRSHNKANFHLRGDLTEDPTHPKLQFPTVDQCRTCHRVYSNGSVVWIENQVFSFLKSMYGRANIVEDVFFEPSPNELLPRNDSQRYMTSSYMFDKVDIGLCVVLLFHLHWYPSSDLLPFHEAEEFKSIKRMFHGLNSPLRSISSAIYVCLSMSLFCDQFKLKCRTLKFEPWISRECFCELNSGFLTSLVSDQIVDKNSCTLDFTQRYLR